MKLIHLDECVPELMDDWQRMTYRQASESGGQLCKQARYMADELFPEEFVWLGPDDEERA